jgi:hypothetical protein
MAAFGESCRRSGHVAWRKNVTGIVKGPLPFFWGVSMSSSTASGRMAIAVRLRRSSAAACSAPSATRRACRRNAACSAS